MRAHALPTPAATASISSTARIELRVALAPFVAPDAWRSLGQLAATLVPFLALEIALYAALELSYWFVLALAVPTAGFVVRLFIIQHDCGHGSFLPARRHNDLVGRLCSLVTLTPYAHWRRQHAGHHAVWNQLDLRASGLDLYSTCLTVAEYGALSARDRRRYRLIQHPLIALLLLPPLIFLVLYRIPFDTPRTWLREKRSVHFTTLALVTLYGSLGLMLGFGAVAVVQLPVIALAAIVGVWLFSLQHRFEHVRWMRGDGWERASAALYGSSHLALPAPLDWLTGHIGFHHVHHLDVRIANHRLRAAHLALATCVELPKPLTFVRALSASRFALWDEDQGRMVHFPSAVPAPPG